MAIESRISSFWKRIDLQALKLPLGFIRCLELLFTLIAASASHGWEFDLTYSCVFTKATSSDNTQTSDMGTSTVSGSTDATTNSSNLTPKIEYKFGWSHARLSEYMIARCNHTGNETTLVPLFPDFDPGTGFSLYGNLVFVSLIFITGSLLVYLFATGTYYSNERLPFIDLIISAFLAFGWIIGTLAFWSSASRIETAASDPNDIKRVFDARSICSGSYNNSQIDQCHSIHSYAMYAPLNIAMLAGCGLVLLFSANVWFCYKETSAFRQQTQRTNMLQQMQHQEPYTLE